MNTKLFTRIADKAAPDYSRIAQNAIKAAERLSSTDARFSAPRGLSDLHNHLAATYAELEPGEISLGLYKPRAGEID